MGQPIQLRKGSETMTVYGRNQAAAHVADGWQLVDKNTTLPAPPVVESAPIDATDAARALAESNGIDLATIEGTGANGRITVGDVRALVDGA